MTLKTANEWATCAGLGGLYIDRTLEVLVEAVRAEFAQEAAAKLRGDANRWKVAERANLVRQCADIVEALARPTTRLVHENGTQLKEQPREPAPAACKSPLHCGKPGYIYCSACVAVGKPSLAQQACSHARGCADRSTNCVDCGAQL